MKIILITLLSASVVLSHSDNHCCPRGQVYNNQTCYDPETAGMKWLMHFYCAPNEDMHVLFDRKTNFTVNSAGKLELLIKNNYVAYEENKFCLADWYNGSTVAPIRSRRAAVLCVARKVNYIDENTSGICMAISSLFLFATASVYASKRRFRNVVGRSTTMMLLSLAIACGILAGMKLCSYSDMTLCAVRGFSTYFFMMAAFFWMNAVSIQMYLKIRKQDFEDSVGEANSGRKMVLYSLYGWCCPLLLTGVMATVNFIPGDHMKPGIGLNHCWFFNKTQQWWYMYSVMSVLLAINTVLFVCSAVTLWSNRLDITLKKRIMLTLRIFILMGITWIFELFSINSKFGAALDILNSLNGVFIYLVLVVPFFRISLSPRHPTGEIKQPYINFTSNLQHYQSEKNLAK